MKRLLLDAVASALDGLEIAFCAFDGQDRALAWNTTFLEFFPEHRGQVHVGEPYADNLRRFYMQRLDAAELPMLQRYIDEGVARHRSQRRPYEFEHHGHRVKVSSVEMGAFGRVRVWRRLGAAMTTQVELAHRATHSPAPAQLPIEALADGVLLVGAGDRIVSANQAFLSLYRIENGADIHGQSFEAVYRRAWAHESHRTEYRRSLDVLKDNQRFNGAPYEVALPGGRWIRVIEQRPAGAALGCCVHVDITHLKRQELALRQAEATARRHQALYRLLCESTHDVTLAVAGGEIVYASPSVSRVLGWEPDELVGRAAMNVLQAGDTGGLLNSHHPATPMYTYRVQVRHADGSRLWMDARARPTQPLDDIGGPETIVVTLERTAKDAHGEADTGVSHATHGTPPITLDIPRRGEPH
ncbi:PAS-domain containing protein [Ideonella sp. DXS29W]|uniref:PAS-domain containing protein n=1 Tax=Ideonella lacteola TaxID=2984193 RepID=A0ABU9BHH0_9BURK